MPLVEYPDSDSEDNDKQPEDRDRNDQPQAQQAHKRKRDEDNNDNDSVTAQTKPAPILPTSFLNLYATNTRTATTDDPTLHGGRQRQTPHMTGHWPSHIYLDWPLSPPQSKLIESLIYTTESREQKACPEFTLHSSLRSDLGVQLPLHISLSAPLTLTTAAKQIFQTDLAASIHATNLQAFTLHPTSLKWASNFAGSRYFLVLTLSRPTPDQDQLNALLRVCNSIAHKHRLAQLYTNHSDHTRTNDIAVGINASGQPTPDQPDPSKPPSPSSHPEKFHISIAWSLTRSTNTTDTPLPSELTKLEIPITHVQLKIGNTVSSIPLR